MQRNAQMRGGGAAMAPAAHGPATVRGRLVCFRPACTSGRSLSARQWNGCSTSPARFSAPTEAAKAPGALCPALAARSSRRRPATWAAAASGGAAAAGGPVPSAQPSMSSFGNVVLPTALALMLCNMDRICLSVAILPMSKEFGWQESMQGVVQSAFLWGYMATQLLGGSLADRYGGKRVFAAGIVWFSLASMLLPAALSPSVVGAGLTIPAVLLARCFVGLGEGVALPCMNNLIATHVPKSAKARGLGMAFSGFHCGNLLGLLLSPLLLSNFGWRGLFYVFGTFGLPLLLMWLAVVPDKPGQQNAKDAAAVPSLATATAAGTAAVAAPSPASEPASEVTVWTLLSKAPTWAIIIVNIVNHWGYFIYLNWMPTYFNKALGLDLRASSFTAFLPWLVMAAGSSLSGILADSLVARGWDVTTVRKVLQTVAFLVPAAALLVLIQPGLSTAQAVACMTVALGTTSLGQAGFVANMSDIAPRHAGMMFGLCNTFGSLSGIVGVTAVGFVVQATQSFSPVFLLTAGMYVVGALVWNLLATGERVFD